MAVVGWDTLESKMTGYRDVPYAYETTGALWNPIIVTTHARSSRTKDSSAFMIAMPAVRSTVEDLSDFGGRVPAPEPIAVAPANDVTADAHSVSASQEVNDALETTGRLSFAREWLSLNISQLAAVLDVTRPTVYDWLSGERSPHPENALRIKQVYDLAREWESASGIPLSTLATTPVVAGRSLVSALSGEVPDLTLAREILARCAGGVTTSASEDVGRALRREALDDAERMARWIR